MFCKNCLSKIIPKLRAEDLILLEYLASKNANSSQCSLSKEIIKKNTNLSAHHCYTSILRLECFGLIETKSWSRANKYFITQTGCKILELCVEIIN